MKQIVYNQVTCLECNEVLISHHRHDYKVCSCPNKAMADGGTAYLRYGAVDMSKIKIFAVYDDDPFEMIREYAERGGRGLNGDQPLNWVKLKDMDDDWLEAILDYGGPEWHINLMKREIEYRKTNKDESAKENG